MIGKNQSFDFNGYWIEKVDYTFFPHELRLFRHVGIIWFCHEIFIRASCLWCIDSLQSAGKGNGKKHYFRFYIWRCDFFARLCYMPIIPSGKHYSADYRCNHRFFISFKVENFHKRSHLPPWGILGVIFYQMWKAAPSSWGEGLLMIFHLNSIQQLSQYVNFIGIALALFVFGNFMIQRQKKTAKK